jgi:uncharacterized membrane protein
MILLVLTDFTQSDMEIILWIIIGIIGLAFYFLPTIVCGDKKQANMLFVVNIFFGWTAVGWLVCLIWAFSGEEKKKKTIVYNTQQSEPDKYDKLAKLKELLDKGAITESEYNTEKQRLLTDLKTEWKV